MTYGKIPYTKKEMKECKYSVGFALSIAEMLLRGKPICMNAIRRYNHDMARLLTLPELNDLVEKVVDDSRYYG